MDSLGHWAQTVNNFGGRIGPADIAEIWKALETSNLGSAKTLPTSEANPIFEPTITLAQMNLPVAIPVDVSFSYANLVNQGLIASPPPTAPGLNQGSGYVRVTWGVPGAVRNVAKIDGGRGWRYPFVASFLRVEYIPSDAESPTQWALVGGQASDLGIQAMISPASGAIAKPLTKTVYFEDVPLSGTAFPLRWGAIPDWATVAHFNAFVQRGDEYSIFFALSGVGVIEAAGVTYSNGAAGEWPNHVPMSYRRYLVQNVVTAVIIANSTTAIIQNPTLICELAL